MAIRCEVCGQYPIKGALRTFFQWPADVNQRVYWRTCLGIQELNIDKPDLYICSDHFEQMQTIRKGTALRKDAFPKRYEGPLPTFPQEDEIPKEELDPPQVKNEEIGIFEEPGPSAPIFDDEEIMPEELSMAKLMHLFAAAAKERPSSIVPLVTPITAETKAFSNILIDRQEKYLDAYCKSCLRQVDVVNMLEANCEGVSVPIMYKTVFMTEIEPSEIPQLMCRACIGLLFQCYKFASMTVKSSEVLRAARERFKYLPAIDDDTIDLKNIPQKYSARSSHKDIAEDEDDKEAVKITSKTVKKRKSPVKSKEAPPEKKGRRTSTRRASVKAKKVSKKILQDSDDEDESNDDNSDNDDADPDFDSVGYEVKDESPDPSDEEDEKEEKEEEQDDNYCMLCRHQFTNMARHMEKVHRVDWESKSCERCALIFGDAAELFKHFIDPEDEIYVKRHLEYDLKKGLTSDLKITMNNSRLIEPKVEVEVDKDAEIRTNTIFVCNKCQLECSTFKGIFDHIQANHKDNMDCSLCETTFDDKYKLLAHYKDHSKKLFCVDHFIAFNTNEELRRHIDLPGHDLQCGICLKMFDSKKKKYNHRRRVHMPAPPVEHLCSECPLVFASTGNLRRHILSVHKKRIFACEECGHSFSTNFRLKKHLAEKHDKGDKQQYQMSVQCEDCGKKFRHIGPLKKHRAVQHLGHTERCGYCIDSFESKEALQKHIEETGHTWVECPKCSSPLKTQTLLSMHLTKCKDKTKNKPKTNRWLPEAAKAGIYYRKLPNGYYGCNMCEREFAQQSNAFRHVYIHLGKKFACEICGRRFSQKQGLLNHLTTHSDQRRYKCQICGAAFKEQSSYYKHKKKHDTSVQDKMRMKPANFGF